MVLAPRAHRPCSRFFLTASLISAIGTKTITLVLLFGLIYGRLDMFVDISLGYAILNFVGVIAMAKYLKATKGF